MKKLKVIWRKLWKFCPNNMGKKIVNFLYSSLFTSGLILGIQIVFGIDISETGIASLILETFCKLGFNHSCGFSWTMTLIGIILTLVPFLYFLRAENYVGLFIGTLFFVSGLFLVIFPTAGVIFLVLSAVLAYFYE